MRLERLVERKRELRAELAKGQSLVQQQQQQLEATRATVLRIRGALSLLEELLAEAQNGNGLASEPVDELVEP